MNANNIYVWCLIGTLASLTSAQVCKTLGASCSSCSTVNICVSINSSAILANCSRPTPYCNAGMCSAVPGSGECGKNFSSFACPEEDGIYPDGSSCNMYHICLNGVAYNYTCPIQNSVFSPGTGSCVRQTSVRCCHKAKCSASSTYAIYPGDHTLFFLCVKMKPTLVLRCAKGFRFDQSRQTCVVKCDDEGRFPDPRGNTTKFVECTMTGPATFASVMRSCPANSTFSAETSLCVRQPSTSDQQTRTSLSSALKNTQPPKLSHVLYGGVRGYSSDVN